MLKSEFPLRGQKLGTLEASRQTRFGKTRMRGISSLNGKQTAGSVFPSHGVKSRVGLGCLIVATMVVDAGDDGSSFSFLLLSGRSPA
jgi:hypothetical protein